MRIVAGAFRGMALASVGKGDQAAHLRPTTDRVRESLFNVLQGGRFGDPVSAARVLDMFAGTGALGLEALSRGAGHVTFVDDGRASAKLLPENIRLTGTRSQTTFVRQDALRLGKCRDAANDLVFLDPPYGRDLGAKALLRALEGGWIAPGALIVWEENAAQEAPDGFQLLDSRRYGGTHATFLRAV